MGNTGAETGDKKRRDGKPGKQNRRHGEQRAGRQTEEEKTRVKKVWQQAG